MQSFRQIAAWRKAHALALNVRRAVRFLPRGYSSLKLQMTAAAESIAFNIVEGSGAASRKEFSRFLGISIKSTSELEYQLQLARDYGILIEFEWSAMATQTIEIRRLLYGFRRALAEADLRGGDASGENGESQPIEEHPGVPTKEHPGHPTTE